MVDQATLPAEPDRGRHLRVAIMLMAIVLGMVGMSYAAVPLYSIFCKVTGYGGTTQRSAGNSLGIIDRVMTTRFDANVSGDLPIKVTPAQPVSAKIGTIETITFLATNLSSHPVTTTASFNVTPELVGRYFNKIECFCFTEQTLAPGETAEMPVTFFLDPEIDKVQDLETVQDVTLSYSFYATEPGRT
ncbi:MAG: cytochrome c oxidase assembly protein [Hyphomicrobiaceae bacterium]|nr:cytochrome c oxidase assembly protein [Hyphomicrobiaceae bacterium]